MAMLNTSFHLNALGITVEPWAGPLCCADANYTHHIAQPCNPLPLLM